MSSYKQLSVYQKSYEAAKEMYLLTAVLPKDEQYGFVSQIKRAATSIPLNIAEGYGKVASNKELVRFLLMARGSCCEMEVLISFIKDFEYIEQAKADELLSKYDEIGKMLSGLIGKIRKNAETEQKKTSS